jgi:hydrogenase maturation protease
VDCLDGGTVGLALLDRLSDLAGLVALDAMKLGKPPGSVTVLTGGDMDAHLRNQHGSVHEVGLSDLMDALRLSDQLPLRRALIGIEPENMDWGTAPTAIVSDAIPEAVAAVRRLVAEWQARPEPEAAT